MPCRYAYRKPGSNAVHCRIQRDEAKQWDFCAHQYYCAKSKRYELSCDACALPQKYEAKLIKDGQEALREAQAVFKPAEILVRKD